LLKASLLKEIAIVLKISTNTAKNASAQANGKLGVHEISGVVRYAAKFGLIDSE